MLMHLIRLFDLMCLELIPGTRRNGVLSFLELVVIRFALFFSFLIGILVVDPGLHLTD
jgi:hypothetical protein